MSSLRDRATREVVAAIHASPSGPSPWAGYRYVKAAFEALKGELGEGLGEDERAAIERDLGYVVDDLADNHSGEARTSMIDALEKILACRTRS